MKRIILTGGGTAGHVTPNIALLPRLKELQYDIHYIGSYNGIEKELISQFGIPYHGISTGKLRRYFSVQNFTDPFRVIKGMGEARKLIKILEPDVIFSKGGFVSVPVVLAGKGQHVPVIIHESDMTPGLANKISIPSATKVCCNFPETLQYLPEDKAVLTGSPIRRELLLGDRQRISSLYFRQTSHSGCRRKPRCRCREQCHPCDSPGASERLPGHSLMWPRQAQSFFKRNRRLRTVRIYQRRAA